MPKNRKIHNLRLALSLLAVILLCACTHSSRPVYSMFIDIPADGWNADEFCEYPIPTIDSLTSGHPHANYDIILAIRHTDRLPYAALRLNVIQTPTRPLALPDTLNIPLTHPSGDWRGAYSKGIFTCTDTLLRAVPAAQLRDSLTLRLNPAMETPSVQGLLNVGLIISPHL